MPTFHRYEPLTAVHDWLRERFPPLGPESLPLSATVGRVLAEAVVAARDHPAVAVARIDGFAVRASDVAGAGTYGPLPLRRRCSGRGDLLLAVRGEAGTTIGLDAGAAVPEGFDAVVPLAKTVERGEEVEILEPVAPGENIEPRGSDFARGATLLSPGRRLRPYDLALLAGAGLDRVMVRRRPRVRLIFDWCCRSPELESEPDPAVPVGLAALLRSLLEADGAMLESWCRAGSGSDGLAQALQAPDADLAVVVGRSGPGAADTTPARLAEAGELAFHGLALEPAHAAGAGRVGEIPVLLLPMPLIACVCAYDTLVRPMLCHLRGERELLPVDGRGRLRRKLVSELGVLEQVWVRITADGIEPLGCGLGALAAADGFLLVPEELEGYPAGTEIGVHLYGPLT